MQLENGFVQLICALEPFNIAKLKLGKVSCAIDLLANRMHMILINFFIDANIYLQP